MFSACTIFIDTDCTVSSYVGSSRRWPICIRPPVKLKKINENKKCEMHAVGKHYA